MTSDESMNVTLGEGLRRLPIYLLLDCSGSMTGAPIEAVRRGVELFAQEVAADPYAMETAYIGVITFDSDARMVTSGLESAATFRAPQIAAGGMTSLGKALRLLLESMAKELRPTVIGGERGDWKPLVFILTDGEPTDDWQTPRSELVNRQKNKVLNVITVGCGPNINEARLKEIAIGPTFRMDASDVSFKTFFKWVSQSVRVVSRAVSQSGEGDAPSTMSVPEPDRTIIQYVP